MPFSACKTMVAPGGKKLATRVGRPMPRFTAMPSRSSWATRMAISSLVNPADVMSRSLHHSLHEDTRCHDVLRLQLARLDYRLGLGDGDARRRGHNRVEVAPGLSIDQVAQPVGLVRLDQREVGRQRLLEDVVAAIKRARLFALRDNRTGTGRRVEGRY